MLQSSLSWPGGICSNAGGVCCQGKGMQEDLAEVEMGRRGGGRWTEGRQGRTGSERVGCFGGLGWIKQ